MNNPDQSVAEQLEQLLREYAGGIFADEHPQTVNEYVNKLKALLLDGYVKKESLEYHQQEAMKYKAKMSGWGLREQMAGDTPGGVKRMYQYHQSIVEQLTNQKNQAKDTNNVEE